MKLHVNAPGLDHTDPVNAQAMFILERIALASSDECAKEDVLTVMTEVNTWLGEQPDADDETSVRIFLLHSCGPKSVFDCFESGYLVIEGGRRADEHSFYYRIC